MNEKPTDLVQGTLEMLVLKTLALEPMHGYGIALRIEQISGGVFRVNPGSLLPALSRMDRAGRIKGEWRATDNNRRAKFYVLTRTGRKQLYEELAKRGIVPSRADATIEAEEADAEVAELLDLEIGKPLLVMRQVALDQSEHPLFASMIKYAGDRYRLRTSFARS